MELGYEHNFRISEKRIYSHGPVTTTLHYNDDGLLDTTQGTDNSHTERSYDLANRQLTYADGSSSRRSTYNINGVQLVDEQQSSGQRNMTTYGDFDALGLPHFQQTYYYSQNDWLRDDLAIDYVNYESPQQTRIYGLRRNSHGDRTPYSCMQLLYDANNATNAVAGSDIGDHNDRLQWKDIMYMDSTYDGLILTKRHLTGSPGTDYKMVYESDNYHYFYTVNDFYLGSYTIEKSTKELDRYYISHPYLIPGLSNKGGQEIGLTADIKNGDNGLWYKSLFGKGGKIYFDDRYGPSYPILREDYISHGNMNVADYIHSVSSSYPPPVPKTYVIAAGDTYQTISQKEYGSNSYANMIADRNDRLGMPLVSGVPLKMPQLIANENKAGNYRPYEEFKALIQGSLYPILGTPESNEDDYSMLVVGIVMVIACWAAPALATALFGTSIGGGAAAATTAAATTTAAAGTTATAVTMTVGQTLTAVAATAVSGALIDAVGQGLAIGLGLQSRFSWQQVLQVGITSGVMAGSQAGLFGQMPQALTTLKNIAEAVMIVGKIAVTQQLAEMAVGIRRQFDIGAVAAVITSRLIGLRVGGDAFGLSNQVLDTVLDSTVHGRNINFDQLVVSMLSTAGTRAIDIGRMNAKYLESQQASKGNALPGNKGSNPNANPVIAARRNNPAAKTPTHSAYRSKSYQDARAEQDLRDQLQIEIDPNQPINFENYGHNRAGFWNPSANKIREINFLANNTRAGQDIKGVLENIVQPISNIYDFAYDVNSILLNDSHSAQAMQQMSWRRAGEVSLDVATLLPAGKAANVFKNTLVQGVERFSLFGNKLKGTGAYLDQSRFIGKGLGKLTNKEVVISEKGLNIVKKHLSQFGAIKENELMLERLNKALVTGNNLTGADASFYIHEVSEATKMSRGISYVEAHEFALNKYQVSPFSVYHPEVINTVNALEPGSFNINWLDFWKQYQLGINSKMPKF